MLELRGNEKDLVYARQTDRQTDRGQRLRDNLDL